MKTADPKLTLYGAQASGSIAVEAALTLLGNELTVLDLYDTVVSRFGPWRERFYEVAPHMTPVVHRVDAEPRLQAFWQERFPLE